MRRWGAGLATLLVAGAVAGGVIVSGSGEGGVCVFPSCFPDETNTGVPTGRSLTTVGTDVTLSTNGQSYEDKIVNGCINVNADNVTIRYVRVNCHGFGIYIENGATGLTVEDAEIDCNGIEDDATGRQGIAYGEYTYEGRASYTARRIDVYGGCENGVWCIDCTIEDSYIHDLFTPYDPVRDPHSDGVQALDDGGSITLDHNTVAAPLDANSALTMDNLGSGANHTVINNLLSGGGYAIYCPSLPSTNMTYTGNHFSTVLDPDVGSNGPFADCPPPGTGITWTGNVIHDGPNEGDPVGPP